MCIRQGFRYVDATIQFIWEPDPNNDICARVFMGVHTRLEDCVNAEGK